MRTSALSPRRRLYDLAARALLYFSAGLTCALLLFLIGYICFRGLPGITLQMLTTASSALKGTVGILPALQNTLFIIVVSLIIVLPLGVGAAIYLTEYATNRRLVAVIEFAAESLSGIPSILYALVGVILFCTAMHLQKSLLAGALTLVIMVLPVILRSTQESLKTVPQSYRTVVLPSSLDGIVTGCILAIGRVVGESAVLMYTAGLSTMLQDFSSLSKMQHASGATLTVALYVYAKENVNFPVAFSIATILLFLTVILNLAASFAGRKLKRS